MSALPFVFNRKTGQLRRKNATFDVEITLCRFHADIFNCLAHAQTRIGAGAIAKAIGTKNTHDVANEIPRLARMLKPLGILIAREEGRGSWLEFEDTPKWRPTIPAPTIVPGNPPW